MPLAKRAGFDGIEMPPSDVAQAQSMKALADEAGVTLHSVIYGGWGAPLSSADPATIERGLAEIEGALRAAKAYGSDAILLVPAVVNAGTRYADAYTRSQANIRRLLPLAAELGVAIAVENVWNNFLLSPLEFARYVDELESPYAKAYFDVGNVVAFGWSEDWILTLGKRIQKIHLKDFKRESREWKNLREGSVDWPKVSAALHEVGYEGYFTCELGGGDEAYLTDIAARVNAIFEGR
jgi:hexulose-6-phosphate isomerase